MSEPITCCNTDPSHPSVCPYESAPRHVQELARALYDADQTKDHCASEWPLIDWMERHSWVRMADRFLKRVGFEHYKEDRRIASADRVCHELAAIRSPASLYQVTGEVPEDVARTLAALTEWMEASELIDAEKSSKYAPQFRIGERVYKLVTDLDLDRMRAEIFLMLYDNLKLQAKQADVIETGNAAAGLLAKVSADDPAEYQPMMLYAAGLVKQIGSFYIARAGMGESRPEHVTTENGEPVKVADLNPDERSEQTKLMPRMDDTPIEGPPGTFYRYRGIHTPVWIVRRRESGALEGRWECDHCGKMLQPNPPQFTRIQDAESS